MILDLIALDNSSRVWVYQANREFTYDELDDAREQIFDFLSSWTAHSRELNTYGNIFHRRFLALFVDESASAGASGCSIDSSARFVQELGRNFDVDFFDRMTYTYMTENEDIRDVSHHELAGSYKNGLVSDDTLFFDHLVKTKGQFLDNWLVPLKESWQSRFL